MTYPWFPDPKDLPVGAIMLMLLYLFMRLFVCLHFEDCDSFQHFLLEVAPHLSLRCCRLLQEVVICVTLSPQSENTEFCIHGRIGTSNLGVGNRSVPPSHRQLGTEVSCYVDIRDKDPFRNTVVPHVKISFSSPVSSLLDEAGWRSRTIICIASSYCPCEDGTNRRSVRIIKTEPISWPANKCQGR